MRSLSAIRPLRRVDRHCPVASRHRSASPAPPRCPARRSYPLAPFGPDAGAETGSGRGAFARSSFARRCGAFRRTRRLSESSRTPLAPARAATRARLRLRSAPPRRGELGSVIVGLPRPAVVVDPKVRVLPPIDGEDTLRCSHCLHRWSPWGCTSHLLALQRVRFGCAGASSSILVSRPITFAIEPDWSALCSLLSLPPRPGSPRSQSGSDRCLDGRSGDLVAAWRSLRTCAGRPSSSKILRPHPGPIGGGLEAHWQAGTRALDKNGIEYSDIRQEGWWLRVGSNHRPHDYESCALTG